MNDSGRYKIMLVDDNKTCLTIGKSILSNNYDVYALNSAEKLFDFLLHVTPDLILLDVEMPGINGYEALTILKADKRYAEIPVIFVTAKSSEANEYDGLALGAIDYVTKPFSALLLLKRIETHMLVQKQKLKLREYNDNLLKMVRDKMKQVYGLQNAIIGTVADFVEFRDNFTGWHISRTQQYLQKLASRLIEEGIYADELYTWDMDVLLPSSQLHDVGKIAIADHILNKPGKLTPEEFEIMKTHVDKGVEAIEKMERYGYFFDYLEVAKIIAGTHHEKWDGSGYPYRLSGTDIPLEGRIMAIADVYDALISVRPYKKAFTAGEAAKIIVDGAGTHFDPAIVGVFEKIASEFAAITKKCNDNYTGGNVA